MKFISDLQNYLAAEFPRFAPGTAIDAAPCPAGQEGDFTINFFKLAGCVGNPMAAAAKAAEFLASHAEVESAAAVKAFVNVTVKPEALLRVTAAEPEALLAQALLPEAERKKILIEFSAPNTNKPQHLGHVRNNTLGMSLASLLKRVGHEVVEINLVNDRGIHICKSMLAYQRFGNGETPESSGMKGDHLVGKYYVRFSAAFAEEVKAVREQHPEWADKSGDELFLETEIGRAAQQMLRDWEAGKPEVRELWQCMNSWVFAGFDETYKRMGIHFDHTYLESETYLLGKDIVSSGLEKGVFAKRDDGAVICDLGKMGKKVVLRSDGTSVYITQDMGTTVRKHDDYSPDTMIWVVGDEQNLHFQMLFEILRRLGYEWASDLHHLSYGMVNLPNGRMKSREGTVVDADDLFDEMTELAKAACKERGGADLSEEELNKRGEAIGLGALKFMLLKFNPRTTMIFDPAASLRFEGDTGPYVQYVAARISSIARKAAERGLLPSAGDCEWQLLNSPQEKDLAVKLYFYPEVLRNAAARRDCSGIADYLLELAKSFNRFYRDCPILACEDKSVAQARLTLAAAVRTVIADALGTLTIAAPEAM
jgi:arginyl-tRNA synthetase